MVMLGFKGDWQKDIDGLNQYIDVVHHGFDVQLAMGILRLSKGCDFSHVIAEDKEEEDASTKNGAENGKKINLLTIFLCFGKEIRARFVLGN